jgi:hypothetical protein
LLDLQPQVTPCLCELVALVEVSDNAVKGECQQETDQNRGNLDEKIPPMMRNMTNRPNLIHLETITQL